MLFEHCLNACNALLLLSSDENRMRIPGVCIGVCRSPPVRVNSVFLYGRAHCPTPTTDTKFSNTPTCAWTIYNDNAIGLRSILPKVLPFFCTISTRWVKKCSNDRSCVAVFVTQWAPGYSCESVIPVSSQEAIY